MGQPGREQLAARSEHTYIYKLHGGRLTRINSGVRRPVAHGDVGQLAIAGLVEIRHDMPGPQILL
jgi:hypothetical protein